MDGARKDMVLDYSQMTAGNLKINYRNFGCFQFIVSHAVTVVIYAANNFLVGHAVGVLVPLLVVIVKLGVHLPTVLRGFVFYIQISPIAVKFLPLSYRLKVDVVS